MKYSLLVLIFLFLLLLNSCSNQKPRKSNRTRKLNATTDATKTSTTTTTNTLTTTSIITTTFTNEDLKDTPEITTETTTTTLVDEIEKLDVLNTTRVLPNSTCVAPSIQDFPRDLFTNRQRRYGGVILHILFAAYIFIAITKLCDSYFIDSLEVISERFNLDEDVAGATFMAAGSSAPEVFISLIGVFVSSTDMGIGTIVGSAVFNILFVIGICALFINAASKLTIWPFFRDSIFYVVSIIIMIIFIHDNKVYWYESLIMLVLYAGYILFMSQNQRLKEWTVQKFKILEQETQNIIPDSQPIQMNTQKGKNYGLFAKPHATSDNNHLTVSGYARFEDDEHDIYAWGGTCDSIPGLENSYQNQTTTYGNNRLEIKNYDYYDLIKNADGIIAEKRRKIDFDTAVLHIMMDKNSFKTRTRFKMAVRLVIDEILWIKKNPNLDNIVKQKPKKHYTSKRSISNYLISNNFENSFKNRFIPPMPDLRDKREIIEYLRSIVLMPLNIIFYYTIPDCKQERFRNWYMITFGMSILWLAILSYFMIWMVTVIGFTIGIPDSIMGITFLAAGASIPDAYSSVIVVRQGYVDMGVSNIFGSNVFDLLIGLAIPWFIKSIFTTGYVTINSNGLMYDAILLFSCVAFTIAAIHFRRWHLDRRLGYVFLSVYAAFIIFSSAIELNLFGMVNPPICKI